ncbi:putative isoflavone 7-O-glucosyltransferase [Helianthus debilis subsp. tardiflorus]
MMAAANLNIAVYSFITSGACCLVEILYLPVLDRDYSGSFRDMNGLVYSPGMPPIPSSDMPTVVLDRNSTDYSDFLKLANYLPKANGVIGWAPQVKVLSHDSVGGFVTHCGWNSVLEGVRTGVPMIAWTQYAEQRLNKIMMVEEMKVALPMDESESGKVAAMEVAKRVRQLMELDEGKIVREVVRALKEDAARAINHTNGSSRVALAKLV